MRYFGGEYEKLDDLEEVEAGGSGFCLRPLLCLLLIPFIVPALCSQPMVSFPFVVELAITASHPNTFLVLRNLVQPPLRLRSCVLRLLWSDHLKIFLPL